MEEQNKLLTTKNFNSTRELAGFVNAHGLKREDIVQVIYRDSEWVLFYFI